MLGAKLALNIANFAVSEIQLYGIAVVRRFCYNIRHESNNADSR